MAKPLKVVPLPPSVRTRRAYFDCTFGQLHVRTAFPTTGGFDEQATLFCLHGAEGSSRSFARFLPEVADVRSVYAPDLPGSGESDPSPTGSTIDAAIAVSDLANDLRLRQIDIMGLHSGAGVALQLAAARPELVRKLVLIGTPVAERVPSVRQSSLVLRSRLESGAAGDSADDLLEVDPHSLAKQIGAFLSGRS